MMIRLDKFLADLGIASRKELKQIIRSGRVTVGNEAVREPDRKVSPENDCVFLDGHLLSYSRFRYFALYKPAGILTACEDRKQKTVMDILPGELKSLDLFPVGRLDKDTTGLLLLTNDGEYAHRVISPKYQIEKVYYAETDGQVDAKDAEAFAAGLTLRDGLQCLPAKLEPLEDASGKEACLVTVMEGKYHQVKRMLASVGKPVRKLHRLSVGALTLEMLGLDTEFSFCELSQEQAQLVFCKK